MLVHVQLGPAPEQLPHLTKTQSPGDRVCVRFHTARNQGEGTGDDDPAPKRPQLLPVFSRDHRTSDDRRVQEGVRPQVGGAEVPNRTMLAKRLDAWPFGWHCLENPEVGGDRAALSTRNARSRPFPSQPNAGRVAVRRLGPSNYWRAFTLRPRASYGRHHRGTDDFRTPPVRGKEMAWTSGIGRLLRRRVMCLMSSS